MCKGDPYQNQLPELNLFLHPQIHNMTGNTTGVSGSGVAAMAMVLCNAIVLKNAYVIHNKWYWMLLITLPAMVFALIEFYRNKH